MARRSSSSVNVVADGAWTIRRMPRGRGPRRAAAVADPLLDQLVKTRRMKVVDAFEARRPVRRGLEEHALDVEVRPTEPGTYVIATRHASGALTFSYAEEAPGRRGTGRRRARGAALRFHVTTQSASGVPGRRGLVQHVLRFFVIKLLGKVVDFAVQKLARAWEEGGWRNRGLTKGLLRVAISGGALRLTPVTNPETVVGRPNLLFVHGTFSNFESAFGGLASTIGADGRTLFDAVRDVYGDRIYAFNHYTVSETPLDNARQLLQALPDRESEFDVITHSRGTLVVRSLLERPDVLGALAHRFRLGNAVLVASPNAGTPLASPERWSTFTNWIGNLIDVFPGNPFAIAVDFIAAAVAWIAKKVGTVIPGLSAMNPGGAFISALQGPPAPSGRLSALVSNYEPDGSLTARMLDLGVDGFFAGANDLVVPTEGGWRVDDRHGVMIPGDRIGCFGPGGNIDVDGRTGIYHGAFFTRPESVEFLVRGLRGVAQALAPLDPATVLPTTPAGRRGSVPLGARAGAASSPAPRVPAASPVAPSEVGAPASLYPLDEILNLFILVPDTESTDKRRARSRSRRYAPTSAAGGGGDFEAEDFARQVARSSRSRTATMIASFRNARVYAPFRTKGGSAGGRWRELIEMHRRLKSYINGDPGFERLPDDNELREFGALLFHTLFPGDVRRLYDSARAELRDRRLDVCLTSTIGWVADMPWEFAFDPSRQMFLCMEEVNFIRNVATAVPADAIVPRGQQLRILVVAAQPIGAGALSTDQEETVIRRGFAGLVDRGLATVDVVTAVTPDLLHRILSQADVDRRSYDVLHFIGHGEFNSSSGFGYLVFEDADGRSHELRADYFRQIVGRRGIRLVFLNACETGTGIGDRKPFDVAQGVAPMLVAGGGPAVLANQFKVLDPSAVAFSQHFYWALASGRTIGDAAREARVAVNYAIVGEAIDWAVPVLFARNPSDRLVMPRSSGGVSEHVRVVGSAAGERRSARRSGAGGRELVAVWDVNYVVPTLDDVVAHLNDAQQYFRFEATDIAAPLGTWRRVPDDQEHTAYLDADEVETKLKEALKRLGVKHLCCVTNLPLADKEEYGLLAHVARSGRISIVSTDEVLHELEPPELSVERLIANFLVFSLGNISGHRGGPKSCPFYYNDERDVRWVAGPTTICRRCMAKLRAQGASAERRQALTAIANAYGGPTGHG